MTTSKQDFAARAIGSLPRPPIHSVVGFGAYWAAPEFCRRHFTQRGERMLVEVPCMPKLLVTMSPADCQAIFTERTGALLFGEALRRIGPYEKLFGSEMIDWWNGTNHDLLRKKVSTAFNGTAMRGYEQTMVDVTERHLARWPIGRSIHFAPRMQALAHDVIVSVVFGVTESDRRQRLKRAFRELDKALESPGMRARYLTAMLRGGTWPKFSHLDRINTTIDAITLEEIAHRRTRSDGAERQDCLELFLGIQKNEENGSMDDRMIAFFQRMLLVGGSETTAVTLSWIVERIVRHPNVLDELDASLARGEDDYLDAIIIETMRLRPAQPVTLRYVEYDFRMNDMLVPANTIIAIYINAIQKRADLYPDPTSFDPQRFLNTRPDPHTWLPFGGGAHRCLGASFAMFEARVLLRTILRWRRLAPHLARGERQDQHRSILLMPHNGATATLLAR